MPSGTSWKAGCVPCTSQKALTCLEGGALVGSVPTPAGVGTSHQSGELRGISRVLFTSLVVRRAPGEGGPRRGGAEAALLVSTRERERQMSYIIHGSGKQGSELREPPGHLVRLALGATGGRGGVREQQHSKGTEI